MTAIFRTYIDSWAILKKNSRYVLLLWALNLLWALLILAPVHLALDKAFRYNPNLKVLLEGFDYSFVMEFLREYGMSINLFLDASVWAILLYLLLQVFLAGGIAALATGPSDGIPLIRFFSACVRNAGKYAQLALLMLVIYMVAFGSCYLFFAKDGFIPFDFDSDDILIRRFFISAAVFLLATFLALLFRDISMIRIIRNRSKWIGEVLLPAARTTFSPSFLVMAVLHLLMIVVAWLIYIALRDVVPNHGLLAFAIGQLFIIFRLSYKIIRLRSFYLMDENTLETNSDPTGTRPV